MALKHADVVILVKFIELDLFLNLICPLPIPIHFFSTDLCVNLSLQTRAHTFKFIRTVTALFFSPYALHPG